MIWCYPSFPYYQVFPHPIVQMESWVWQCPGGCQEVVEAVNFAQLFPTPCAVVWRSTWGCQLPRHLPHWSHCDRSPDKYKLMMPIQSKQRSWNCAVVHHWQSNQIFRKRWSQLWLCLPWQACLLPSVCHLLWPDYPGHPGHNSNCPVYSWLL